MNSFRMICLITLPLFPLVSSAQTCTENCKKQFKGDPAKSTACQIGCSIAIQKNTANTLSIDGAELLIKPRNPCSSTQDALLLANPSMKNRACGEPVGDFNLNEWETRPSREQLNLELAPIIRSQ